MKATNHHLPQIDFEVLDSGNLRIEQAGTTGGSNIIEIHPVHLRAMAEAVGLVPSADPQAVEIVQKLARRLLVLRERSDHLAHWLYEHSDTKHADLSYEQTFAEATSDIAGEYCADLGAFQAVPGEAI